MSKKPEESNQYNRCIVIVGFRNAKIKDVNDFLEHVRDKAPEVCVQFFDARTIAGQEHLRFAALNALKAFKHEKNISSNLAIETLLYASAQRQIRKAVEMLGIKKDSSQIVVLIIAESKHETSSNLNVISKLIPGERDDSVWDLTDEKIGNIKRLFNISDVEIGAKLRRRGEEREALTDLVIEHGALLAT